MSPRPSSWPIGRIDAYSPAEIAARIEAEGVAKAQLSVAKTATLGVLAGAFIAFGAMFYTTAITGSTLGFGPTRLLGGVAFSLGLILVVIAGAELFTGNNLIVMAWADRRIGSAQLLRNWAIVYAANFVGAVACAVAVHWSGTLELSDGAVAATARAIATSKAAIGWAEGFWRGVLCNALVCLAVWLCHAAHDVASRILAVVFPIAAFVALGFEHSVANMYFMPLGLLEGAEGVSFATMLRNLTTVTAGNIVGGSVWVAAVYWIVYLRKG